MTKFDIFVVNLRRSVDRREAMREKIARIKGFRAIYIDDEMVCYGNSPLELHSADLANFECSQTISLVSHSKFAKNSTTSTANTRIVDSSIDSSLREFALANSWQSKQNNLHEVQTESRPIRGAKNRIQGCSSATADFLLESDKRGSPPKSEKRQLLARRGSGAGGAALLRKDSNDKNSVDSKADLFIKSHKKIDSDLPLDSRDLDSSATLSPQNDESMDCFGQSPRNDDRTDCYEISRHTERSEVSKSRESNQMQNAMTQERMGELYRFAQSEKIVGDSRIAKMDSSLTAFAQNDDMVVCHESLCDSRNDNNIDFSPQDEFASILHFHFFPATDATKFKNGESPLPPQYSSKLTRFVKGKDLSFGEMACFSSHYRLWQKCVALDSPIIVLEDDIDFMQDFCQIVDIFKSPFEYVRLHYTMDKKTTHLRDNFYMSYNKVCGTLGYYLTPQAAQKFIKNARFWLFCVDDYMDMFFIHSVKNIIFKPFIISEDLHSATQSTILGREKPQMRFYQKLTRELSRIYFFVIRKYLYFALHFAELRAFFRAHKSGALEK